MISNVMWYITINYTKSESIEIDSIESIENESIEIESIEIESICSIEIVLYIKLLHNNVYSLINSNIYINIKSICLI